MANYSRSRNAEANMSSKFSRILPILALVGGVALAGCSDVASAPFAPEGAELRKDGSLPNGARWSELPTIALYGTDGEYAGIDFKIQGAGNTRSVVITGEVHVQATIQCVKTKNVGRTLFDRKANIKGSGTFYPDSNGRVDGFLRIYRNQGNPWAKEFCKSQNFQYVDGSIVAIRSLGQGSYIEAPSPLGRYEFSF
jgi:hypothetical protein